MVARISSLLVPYVCGATGLFLACSGTPAPSAAPLADAAPAVVADAGRDASRFVDLDSGSRVDGGQTVGADGWATFDANGCTLRYPVRPEAYPPPPTWVPCPAAPGIPAGACRMIRLDDEDSFANTVIYPHNARLGSTGIQFAFNRYTRGGVDWMVTDIDGPVRRAFHADNPRCGPSAHAGSKEGRFVARLRTPDPERLWLVGGPLATGVDPTGRIIGEPEILDDNVELRQTWFLTEPALYQTGGLRRIDWETGQRTQLIPAGARELSDGVDFQAVGPRFYARADFPYQVYEYASGTPIRLVTAGSDVQGEVGNFGIQEGRIAWSDVVQDASGQRTELALYTQELDANGRRVGQRQRISSPQAPDAYLGRMGCNKYVKRYKEVTANGMDGGFEMFDFSTMKHWRISFTGAGDRRTEVGFQDLLLVTCEEAILQIRETDPRSSYTQMNIARIDYAKLGPGEPFTVTPDPAR